MVSKSGYRRWFLLAAVGLLILGGGSAKAQSTPLQKATSDPVIAAVGDIACKNAPGNNRKVCQYDDVAALIEQGNYDRFLPLGDNQYESGSFKDYRENYDVYFGDLLPITEPVPGNHEYGTENARGYFRYFEAAAHGPGGYYSYDLGGWHIVALNSAICPAAVGCGPGDPQFEWLRNDLAQSDAACTLAYWHHPRFDWLHYQKADWTDDYEFQKAGPFWRLLFRSSADLVLSGHNHNYSRWQPMNASGAFDPANGVTQFIVGTGGRNLNDFGGIHTRPNTFVTGQSTEFGFLELTLHQGSYDFRYRSTLGDQSNFIDEGSGVACR